jgi:hypothetical protein
MPAGCAGRELSAMRAIYVPAPAATAAVERLVVTTLAAGAGGELTVCYKDGRRVRDALSAGQLRGVLRRWAAAARAGLGELVVGD